MANNAKPEAEKAKNYTAEQEAEIIAAAPMNLEKAKTLAEKFGKSWRSVSAKALSLGVEYISQEKPAKRPAKESKSELVSRIEEAVEYPGLSGLEKATLQSLVNLLSAIKVALHSEPQQAE